MNVLLLLFAILTGSPLFGFTGLPTYLQNLTLPGPNGNIQLAVSANGQALAVWANWPNQGAELQAAFFNGTSWVYLNNNTSAFDATIVGFIHFINPTPTLAPNGTFATGSAPKVGIDNNGNATLVWVAPNSQIIAARYAQGNLSNVTQLTTTASNTSPTLAVNPDGVAVVVWIESAPFRGFFARSFNPAPGGGWSNTFTFMPIPAPGTSTINQITLQNIPASPLGTYPPGIGLSNTATGRGIMVWIDGPTGTVRAGNFAIP